MSKSVVFPSDAADRLRHLLDIAAGIADYSLSHEAAEELVRVAQIIISAAKRKLSNGTEDSEDQEEMALQREYSRGRICGLSEAGRVAMTRSSIRWTNHKDPEAKMWRGMADDLFELAKQEEDRFNKLRDK